VLDRTLLLGRSLEVAPLLLGGVLTCTTEEGCVSLRITEIEAYHGSDDPGSHAFRGKTKRNSVMFGEPGHLYTYFTYGMHTCANVVCSPEGTASVLLLRGGKIVDGLELARSRRLTSKRDADLARGPARLTVALGITLADGGADLATSHIRLELSDGSRPFATGPRTGLSGPGGGDAFPWRYWLPGEPSVSPYKRHSAKKRA
jgi:DNA-3-methyladenine glycosylase